MAEKLKILMVFTANMNLGDSVIGDSNYYLIQKAFFPRKCEIFPYTISSRDVEQIKYVDAVVFAGGIFKSTSENFWLYIPELLEAAQRYNVPVLLNGIGVEAFHPDDEKSVNLKNALNLPCVKCISVRDDIETLKSDYITNPDIEILPVYDVAVWSKDVYKEHLKQMPSLREKKCIGLGITREKIFADYGNPQITKQVQLDFWKGVITLLEEKGLQWKAFTNGDPNDELFAKEVLAYTGHGEKAPVPMDAVSLVQTIAQFQAVIAGRMHSNIISYALGIPSVGFVWNQKLAFWGKRIGYPERFLFPEEMTPQNAVSRLLQAMKEGCRPTRKQKKPIYAAVKNFAKVWCKKRNIPKEIHCYPEKMMAPALGGISLRYKNTNSMEAFWDSYAHGYRNFQLDLRLTSDDVLVCVNRWHPETFQLLGHPLAAGEAPKAMAAKEFSECKYYNRFSTLSFEGFLKQTAPHLKEKKIEVVLSIGCPSKDIMQKMAVAIPQLLQQYGLAQTQFKLRLERKNDILFFKEAAFTMDFIYYMVCIENSTEKLAEICRDAVAFCQSQNVRCLALSPANCRAEIVDICKKASIDVYLFTSFKVGEMVNALNLGAHMVSNHYYGVDYVQRLTQA